MQATCGRERSENETLVVKRRVFVDGGPNEAKKRGATTFTRLRNKRKPRRVKRRCALGDWNFWVIAERGGGKEQFDHEQLGKAENEERQLEKTKTKDSHCFL